MEEKEIKLTTKQQKFLDGILDGLSKADAYRQAYDCSNSKTASIYANSHVIYNHPKIQAKLKQFQEETKKRHEVTADRVIEELSKLAFVDIKDFLEYRTEKTKVGEDPVDGEPIIGYETIIELKDSKTVDTAPISEIRKSRDGSFVFKTYSKENALINLGKYLGIFTEKNEMIFKEAEGPGTESLTNPKIKKAFEVLYPHIKKDKSEKDGKGA